MMDANAIPGGEIEEDRNRARLVAAARRRRDFLLRLGVRLASLAIVLVIWQLAAAHIDPVLFTSPSAIAVAAAEMIRSGELWTYLWPSLVVLFYGLTISFVSGVLVGVLLARYWLLDMALGGYITFLYATPTVALVPIIVGWLRCGSEDYHPGAVRLLPGGDQHLSGREERGRAVAGSRPLLPLQ